MVRAINIDTAFRGLTPPRSEIVPGERNVMRMNRWHLAFGVLLAGTVAGVGSAEDAARTSGAKIEKEESWQVIHMSGQRIGYSRSLLEPFDRDGEPMVRSSVEMHMTIKRFGQTLRMGTTLHTEETADGQLRKFSFEQSNPPAGTQKTSGVVNGDKVTLETEVAGKKSTSTKPWDPANKSPVYQDRVLREKPLEPGESQSFDAYLPEFGKVVTVKIVAEKEDTVELLDEQETKALKVRLTQSAIPGLATIGWIDGKGETLKSSTSVLGTEMVTYKVSRDEALKEIDTKELDLAVSTLIKVKPIPGLRDREEITYRIHLPGQNPSEYVAADDVQSIKPIDDQTIELTIRPLPIPKKGDVSNSPGPEFLQASEFLQSEDGTVRKLADEAAGKETDPAAIARAMEKFVRNKLDKKNFSTALASAAEVAKNLEGDCTEHAVLLAAMLRAKQIPSRVAVGIVYVEHQKQPSFGGHMWTEAWLNGKWVPLDGTLGVGGATAGHIKMGDASFSDENTSPVGTFAPLMLAIGSLQIDVAE